MSLKSPTLRIDSFDFPEGKVLGRKYEVMAKLGSGWEGEVYMVRERRTGIERAAKFFYPQRNPSDKTLHSYARKLHRLRNCPIVIRYHTEENIFFRKAPVSFLISEYVEGELLNEFIARQRGKRVTPFQGIHFLHALAKGLEDMHRLGEYHGDLHAENVIVRLKGLKFELKVLDMFHWNVSKRQNIQDDVCDMIKLFYDAVGGVKHYSGLPVQVKDICCGLKRSLILKKFKTAGQLRKYLEQIDWG